jgi:hypothetical protein
MRGLLNGSKTKAVALIVLKVLKPVRRRIRGRASVRKRNFVLGGRTTVQGSRENAEKATVRRNQRAGIALESTGRTMRKKLVGTNTSGARRPTGRKMKLTDLFSRARKRAHYHNEIEVPARLGNDAVDRSSMADLVRLLKEAEDEGSSRQPA